MSVVRQLYQGRVVDLRLEDVLLPNGATIQLEIVRHPGASAIVAVDDNGAVTLIRQYRHATGGYLWEIPAGKLDGNETPVECAARELREEAGLIAAELIHLGTIFTAPGFCDERIHLFLGRRLSSVPQQLEIDEILSVEQRSLADALAMIRTGAIDDAKTIAGLYHAAAVLGVAMPAQIERAS